MNDESADLWISRLNAGEVGAVERVFAEYEPLLRIAVGRRMNRGLRAKVDSGDVVQTVFADLVEGVRTGGWKFAGRSPLVAMLLRIARRRLADQYHKHRYGLKRECSLAETESREHPESALPRPSQVAQGGEFLDRVLKQCRPEHREIVRLRMGGARLEEIAERTRLHEGSVRRILYDLARGMSISRRETDRD